MQRPDPGLGGALGEDGGEHPCVARQPRRARVPAVRAGLTRRHEDVVPLDQLQLVPQSRLVVLDDLEHLGGGGG